MFESINACLFASKVDPILRAKDITRTHGQTNVNDMVVEIEFQHEAQSYVLNRQWVRRPGYSEYSVNSVSLRSILQNLDSSDSSTDEDEIAEFMNSLIPYQTRSLFLFDGEQVQTYIDEASNSVRDAIERLLGLHLYIQLEEDVRRVEQDLQQERRSHDIGEDLLARQESLDRNEAELRSIERRRRDLRQASSDAKADYTRLQTEESRLQGMFDPMVQADRRELETQRATLTRDIERYENALAELVPNELAILWFWPEVLEAPNAHPKRKSDLPRTIPELATLLYNHREAIGTALSADSIDLLNAVLHKSMGEGTKDDLTLQLELGVDRFISLVEGGLEKIDSYPEQLRLMRSSLDRVAHEIGSLPSAESINIDVKRLHDEMEGLRTAQARHEASLNTLSHDEERLQLESDGLRRDIARLTENKQKYRSLSNAIHMCRQVRDVLAMFVNDYRSTRIGQLQTIVNRKFRELTNSPGLIDTIEIDRNQVELKLLGRNAEMLAQEQSAGQKEILAFALIASVVELSNRQVPAIIDTPLARLDMAHRTNVLRRFFPYLGPQVIILATDTEVGLDEVNELSPILATSHHLHLDPQTSCTTIRNGYLDE